MSGLERAEFIADLRNLAFAVADDNGQRCLELVHRISAKTGSTPDTLHNAHILCNMMQWYSECIKV